MEPKVFHGITSLQSLTTDEFRFCCLVPSTEIDCNPKPDEFSSCEDLMSNLVLRCCIWILGIIALVGNVLVIMWRIRHRAANRVHSFLISNLAFGDFLMGIYLIIIAAIDWYYRGVYFIHDASWRQSELCKLAGFVCTVSSEISVFTLTLITMDRFIAIVFPFRMKRLELKHIKVIVCIIWVVCLIIGGIPLLSIQYFQDFYGRSGVCLALHITHQRPNGWEYSVFIYLVLNLISFTLIAVAYVSMFFVARKTHRAVNCRMGDNNKNDSAMARR